MMGHGSTLLALMLLIWFNNVIKIQGGSQMVQVLTFNRDGARRDSTWLEYGDSPLNIAGDYTLCLRFNILVFRLLTAVIYLLDTDDFDHYPISFEVYFEKIRTKYGGYGRFYPLPANLATNKWYHYCQVRDTSGSEGRVYLDGQLIVQESITFDVDTAVRDVMLGQDEFQMPYSLSGSLSQVNLWSRVLTQDEIVDMARCQVTPEGDVIRWSGQWVMHNLDREEVPLEELCGSVSRGRLTVPLPLLRYHHAVKVCLGLRGIIVSPTTHQELVDEMDHFAYIGLERWRKPGETESSVEGANTTALTATTTPYPPMFERCADRQWGASNDEQVDGVWYNPFTNENLNNSQLYFKVRNPDGDKYQNCLLMRSEGLLDTDCNKKSCTACHTTAGSTWTLRGICEEEKRMYYFDLVALPLSFRGYGEYRVEEVGHTWAWYNSITNTTLATLAPQKNLNYPIGRLTWNIKDTVCGQESGSRELTLSACTPGEFTCTDGTCIPFTKRCDLKFDCGDKTDESLCDIINFPGDYRSKLPPRPVSDRSLPISVNVSVDTINIDTSTMLLSVSYNLRLTWHDNRLTYNNLKALTRLNTVSLEQVDQLWRPKVGFINTDDIQHTAVDQDAVTTVLRRDPHFIRDLSGAYEVEIYRGDTNPVSTTRKYSTVFTCNFDLVLYPFDIQKCSMQLQILSASSEYLIFNSSSSFVRYLGQKLLVEYGIGQIDLQVDTVKQYSEMRVRIELIRRYGYAMLNIYIPSLTLLIISYVTLFFRPTIFEVRVMTALTALLVLATLFTQVSASLPKTSYFKMVDIWLLFCIVLIFFIIIFHTIIDLHVDYAEGSALPSASKGWTQSSTASSGLSVVKVSPAATGDDGGGGDIIRLPFKIPKLNFNVRFYIALSKITMFIVFFVFNVSYWGTLAAGSGLVYYY